MQIKTQYLGRDVREKMRELVLEEHESCECRCLVVTASQCMRPGKSLPITLQFRTLNGMLVVRKFSSLLQGDTSGRTKPSVDIKKKLHFSKSTLY